MDDGMKTLIVYFRTKDYENSEWVNRFDWMTFKPERGETAAWLLNSMRVGWRQSYHDYELTNTTIG
ncbi:hypothetical protein PMW_110 [Pseudomonas phage phiPMW]|uniref:Uncharacterized protein n=1 Tax=Pseudomonas phage phiPMW TaxID=1815582 RepID=A0A1S5R1E3_9CAUD|nr:hypothetical protein FDG97_gp110 [Pseudomonas phage phiPMW]ANA49235.1 hypothetical protein PMW_110 [Pseudomonas phage phiPMW]